MYIIYYFFPSVPEERGDEAEVYIDDHAWNSMVLSECCWIVPGTIDPRDD